MAEPGSEQTETTRAPDATQRIARLTLTDFRSHAALDIAPDAKLVVLTGPNGAGKTNILEAVSLLAPGRGLRRAPLAQIARQGGPGGFAVSADLAPAEVRIGTGIRPGSARRLVRVNGAEASAHALGEWLRLIWLTPAMDRLFIEGAGERRRFFDRLVLALEPGHGRAASRYEAAMRERNRLLAGEEPVDPAWLDAIEARMADEGAALIAARARAIEALGPRLERAPDAPFARPQIALADAEEGGGAADPAALAARWRAMRPRDAAAGRTLAGPHRADLIVRHAASGQAAGLCSTGEQKALLLSLILAHAALIEDKERRAPLLLLDEVAAHLDPERRAALIERLDSLGGQVWMTGTDAGLFDAAREQDACLLTLPMPG